MRRREFITLAGGVAATWPFAASAQADMPVVGFLNSLSPAETSHVVSAFRQGVAQAGLIERKTVRFDYLYADGLYDRLPAMAAEFVRQPSSGYRSRRAPCRRRRKGCNFDNSDRLCCWFRPGHGGIGCELQSPRWERHGCMPDHIAAGAKTAGTDLRTNAQIPKRQHASEPDISGSCD